MHALPRNREAVGYPSSGSGGESATALSIPIVHADSRDGEAGRRTHRSRAPFNLPVIRHSARNPDPGGGRSRYGERPPLRLPEKELIPQAATGDGHFTRKDDMDNPPFPELLAAFRNDPASLLWRVPGIVPVRKPSGPTSHDIVAIARRQLRLRRVGHGGTLDPDADGVLLLLTGNATRLFDALQIFDKEYVATFRLGTRTDTQDATGRVTEEAPAGTPMPERALVEDLLPAFTGTILQTPPMYSALKKGGRKLVDLARQGVEVERDARPVEVHAVSLEGWDGRGGTLRMTVGSGVYVRTLIDDLGVALGTFAHMTSLTRTRIGPFTLADAVEPEGIADAVRESP